MSVVLATHTQGAVRVFRRDERGALEQVAQLAATHDVDPASLLTLVSDLDLQLGWSANGHVVERAETDPPRQLPSANDDERPQGGVSARERIIEQLRASDEPLTIQQLGGENARHHVRRLIELDVVTPVKTPSTTRKGGGTRYRLRQVTRRPRASRSDVAARRQVVLDALAERGQMTAMEIAPLLGLASKGGESTTRSMLNRMRLAGLVDRVVIGTMPNGYPAYAWRAP